MARYLYFRYCCHRRPLVFVQCESFGHWLPLSDISALFHTEKSWCSNEKWPGTARMAQSRQQQWTKLSLPTYIYRLKRWIPIDLVRIPTIKRKLGWLLVWRNSCNFFCRCNYLRICSDGQIPQRSGCIFCNDSCTCAHRPCKFHTKLTAFYLLDAPKRINP